MEWPRKLTLPAGLVLAGLVIWLALPHWRPLVQLQWRQEAFLKAVEDRKPRRIDDLVASDYEDQWGLDRDGLIRACDDFRRYFLSMTLEPVDAEIFIEEGQGIYRARIRLQGSPVGPGSLIRTEANRLQTPFVFTWKRSGLFPWQWLLWRVENEELPTLRGYDPALGFDLLDIP